jgi:O-antigen/teichoic acid export membrane protein
VGLSLVVLRNELQRKATLPRLRVWTSRVLVSGLGPAVTFGSRFAGNIILSRLLSPEEFGSAIAITTVLGIGGLVTDVALDRFVIIDGSKQALASAHLISVVNSILLALVLVVISPEAARLFGVPAFAGSFALAAAFSALGGFAHLGIKQVQRDFNFVPEGVSQVAANFAGLAALCVGATVLHDHRAIVAGFGIQLAAYLVLSHVLAESSYRIGWDRNVLRKALLFGLPLMLNGVGLAIMYQLDRVIVGYWFGVRELATYAVVFSLGVVPVNLISGVFGGPSLSYLLSGDASDCDRSDRYRLLLGFYSIITSIYALWMVSALDIVVPLIFGARFTVSPTAHVLFTLIACLRLQRGGAPTLFFLASGKTGQLAFLNLVSGTGLAIALGCIMIWPRLESMLIGITIGELISFTLFFAFLERARRRSSFNFLDFAAAIAVPIAFAAVLAWRPEVTLQSRSILLGAGIVAIGAQIVFELHKNRKFRDLLVIGPFRSGSTA